VANFVEIRSLSIYKNTESREIRVNGQRTEERTDRQTDNSKTQCYVPKYCWRGIIITHEYMSAPWIFSRGGQITGSGVGSPSARFRGGAPVKVWGQRPQKLTTCF